MKRHPLIFFLFCLLSGWTAAERACAADARHIFPAPADQMPGKGEFQLGTGTIIYCDPKSLFSARHVQSALMSMGIQAPIEKKKVVCGKPYILVIDDNDKSKIIPAARYDHLQQPDAYYLSITEQRILIAANDNGGVLYGALALLQVVDRHTKTVQAAEIVDQPAMTFRGLRGHFPGNNPDEIERFKAIVRAMAYCRLNQLWIRDLYVRRFPGSLRWTSHPEIIDPGAISKELAQELIDYAGDYNVKVMGSISSTADAVQSIYPDLIEMAPDEHPSTVPIKNLKRTTAKYRMGARFNLCPSREETYELLFDLIDEIAALFTSEVIDLGIDEVSQSENGSRWVADAACLGKDPVQLFADFTNRLADYVIAKGKIPLVNSTPFIKQHGGDFFNIYRSVDLIRKEVIINNWSEKIARERSWFLDITRFSSTAYFKRRGFQKIIHLTGSNRRWRDRPDLLESRGAIDCHGAFITHYTYMTGKEGVRSETIEDMAFSGQHFWTPDQPVINSALDKTEVIANQQMISELLAGARFHILIPK